MHSYTGPVLLGACPIDHPVQFGHPGTIRHPSAKATSTKNVVLKVLKYKYQST